jgi:signal transduction histidine kinase
MKIGLRLHDTIGRRFALTIAVTVAVALGLNGLFITFAGVWGHPSIDRTGLLDRAGDLVRVLEAAPVDLREALAGAASNPAFRVDWYASNSSVSIMLGAAARLKMPDPEVRFVDQPRRTVHFDAENPVPSDAGLPDGPLRNPNVPSLSVELKDGSWTVFTAPRRTWGLGQPARAGVGLAFLIVSIVAVSTVAAYQMSRPIRQFAFALRRFGSDPRASAIPESGPRELRETIQAFNAMQAQIQKFVEDRTAMLAAISHDLRTPLTKVRLRGEYIEDKEQQARLFDDVDTMQAMIDSALSFFRDDIRDERTTTFDFPELLRTIVDGYSDQGSEVVYHGPEHTGFRGRPFALKRAFTNLVDNAVKHGGASEVELVCTPRGFSVVVRDSGPGIPPEMFERVFAPFYRLDPSRNRATGGVGLGLTSARAVIRGHGGDIALRNRAPGGLEVEVTLPLTPEP